MTCSRPLQAFLLILIAGGCEKADKKAPAVAAPQAARLGTASIKGVIALTGKAPVMGTIANQPCHAGAGPIQEEAVVVDPSNHLANVIVFLEDAPPARAPGSLPPVVLDQVNCRYVPHVLALQTGQTLHITTNDPTLHNVHGLCTVNPAFNFALVAPGQSKDLTFAEAELFQLRCDVHPWMKANVRVFSHPWFAVTDKNGSFEIRNVPSGSFTLAAWQEKYGVLRQSVKIDDGKVTGANFRFESGL
jgi:plastocyanin